MSETAIVGLRLAQGVHRGDFALRFGRDFESVFGKRLAEVRSAGLVEESGDLFGGPLANVALELAVLTVGRGTLLLHLRVVEVQDVGAVVILVLDQYPESGVPGSLHLCPLR